LLEDRPLEQACYFTACEELHQRPARFLFKEESAKEQVMSRIFTGVTVATLMAVLPAMAQTANEPSQSGTTAGATNSGPGVQGPPDTRTGPSTKDADKESTFKIPPSDGASSGEMGTENTATPSQDSSGVKGLPGNKSGSSATRTDRLETKPAMGEQIPSTAQLGALAQNGADYFVTQDQKKEWIGKPVYSSDGENLGEIADVETGTDNKVTEIQADIGGFLGFGETRVSVGADKIQELKNDRIVLKLKEAEANDLRPISE
jgi:sporulation protein YlmC with PRC-barrel domain